MIDLYSGSFISQDFLYWWAVAFSLLLAFLAVHD